MNNFVSINLNLMGLKSFQFHPPLRYFCFQSPFLFQRCSLTAALHPADDVFLCFTPFPTNTTPQTPRSAPLPNAIQHVALLGLIITRMKTASDGMRFRIMSVAKAGYCCICVQVFVYWCLLVCVVINDRDQTYTLSIAKKVCVHKYRRQKTHTYTLPTQKHRTRPRTPRTTEPKTATPD